MADRLEDIKEWLRIELYSPGGDVAWLIAEIEKLRAQKKEGLDIIAEQDAIIRHLSAELDRCANEHE